MLAHLHVPDDLERALLTHGFTAAEAGSPTVIATGPLSEDWTATLDSLTEVFRVAKSATVAGAPIVFVVSADALLGRRGPTEAMAATGIVSAARTLAAEQRKAGVPVNCVAITDDSPADVVARWAEILLTAGGDGPTGELIQLGGIQIGKALS
jgi:hypothetical protein